MGLAASQARLLTITARKSDAEFQSMRYSHDKIALSRSMTDISTEYQNSLNQTKLVYDFYGNGDTNTQLSYGLMMTPSIMNGYMPMITTNTSGRVVLNNQYAAAARAAGIPVEGLGCLPSEDVRNKFIQGLADAGLISQVVADNCMGIHYSQEIGMGTKDLVSISTEKMNLSGLLDYLDSTGITINMHLDNKCDASEIKLYTGDQSIDAKACSSSINFSDLLKNDYTFVALSSQASNLDANGEQDGGGISSVGKVMITNRQDKTFESLDAMVNWSGWDTMMDAFENALNTTDPGVKAALEIAREKTNKLIRFGNKQYSDATNFCMTDSATNNKWKEYNTYTYYQKFHQKNDKGEVNWQDNFRSIYGDDNDAISKVISGEKGGQTKTILSGNGTGFGWYGENTASRDYKKDSDVRNICRVQAKNHIGYVGFRNMGGTLGGGGGSQDQRSGLAISVSNIAKAYLTYFVQAMEGMNSQYKVNNDNGVVVSGIYQKDSDRAYHYIAKDYSGSRAVNDSHLIETNSTYEFDVVTSINVNQDHAMISGFYDALFNQICTRGWSENSQIDDNEYLASMYKDGKYFLATCSEDGFYNAGNYATNTYIREVTDNDAIAKAEAKYNTEKLKINQKEEILDLKMKNLDTEISSLTTEYDTIKSVISKQIEKCFKRYDA